jgi:hypothetical protein
MSGNGPLLFLETYKSLNYRLELSLREEVRRRHIQSKARVAGIMSLFLFSRSRCLAVAKVKGRYARIHWS